MLRGYVVLIWRARHVVGPTELTKEAAAFCSDMVRVSRAMQTVYGPLKTNYQLFGNRVAHLHWIQAPRFLDDVAPGDPLQARGMTTSPRTRRTTTTTPTEMAAIVDANIGPMGRVFIGVVELLAAVGLLLPGLTRILPSLTVLAAGGLVGETASAISTLVILVLLTVVACAR